MKPSFEARWISKQKKDELRKTGSLDAGIVLDSLKGFVVVQPLGSQLADGQPLTLQDADYELRPEWCLTSRTVLSEARKLLGLPVDFGSPIASL